MPRPTSAAMHPGPGFRVRLDFERPDPAVVARFREFETPDISDQLNRVYAVDSGIQSMTGDHQVLCGPACTVQVFAGDNLMVHKVLDVAKPGDIVVIDAKGPGTNAVVGDMIGAKAKHRGIQGFVIHGMVRDVPGLMELDYPVFAHGATPVGPLHRGPGEINFPIACGGVVVHPGDIVVADRAGTVIVPQGVAAELVERLDAQKERQAAYQERVRRGEFSNDWVDDVLRDADCPFLEE